MNRTTNEISAGHKSQSRTPLLRFNKEKKMSHAIAKIIFFSTVLPLLLTVSTSQSWATITSIKIAESNNLTTANLEHQSSLSNRNLKMKVELAEVLGRGKDRRLQSDLLLVAARNEKTRECRVSGLCS
ncbi:hypothetical protein PN499_10885 [Kamptonema animale CS-326]|jgi:hypothetical protein|uniref:hypothetical protein n=1 Tax=Kamptonema animale TaxID=92934 RepID=UPI00232B553D|nr:hypothetical protein [Kamptonema animale]MDB9511689.1 hypothetical protein [Kamptonema animale CS-326]